MANTIRYIDDDAGDHVFPVTHERGVFDDNGTDIGTKITQLGNEVSEDILRKFVDVRDADFYGHYAINSSGAISSNSSCNVYRFAVQKDDTFSCYCRASNSYAALSFAEAATPSSVTMIMMHIGSEAYYYSYKAPANGYIFVLSSIGTSVKILHREKKTNLEEFGVERFTYGRNVLQPLVGTSVSDTDVWGSGYLSSTGTVTSSNNYYYTKAYIPVLPGSYVSRILFSSNAKLVYYDKDKTVLGALSTGNATASVLRTLPANSAYIRISLNGSDTSTLAMVFQDEGSLYVNVPQINDLDTRVTNLETATIRAIENNLYSEIDKAKNAGWGGRISYSDSLSTLTDSIYGQPNAQYSIPIDSSAKVLHIKFRFKLTNGKFQYVSASTNQPLLLVGSSSSYQASIRQQAALYNTDSGLMTRRQFFVVQKGDDVSNTTMGDDDKDCLWGEPAYMLFYKGDNYSTASSYKINLTSSAVTITDGETQLETISVDTDETVESVINKINANSAYLTAKAYEVAGLKYSDCLLISNVTLCLSSGPKYYLVRSLLDKKWHTVEAILDYNKLKSWTNIDGHTIIQTITEPSAKSIYIGGRVSSTVGMTPVTIRDLHIGFDYEDAEIITYPNNVSGTIERLISNDSPYLMLFEGHGMEDKTNTVGTTNDMDVTTDRLRTVFDYLQGKGYTPVSWQQVIDWRLNGTPLPKRCYTLMFDDFRIENYMRLAYRLPFVQFGVKPGLAVITGQNGETRSRSEEVTIDGQTWTLGECFDAIIKGGWYPCSHTKDHTVISGIGYSELMPLLKECIYSCDKLGIYDDILVYPTGSVNKGQRALFDVSGFALGVGVSVNGYNSRLRNRYNLVRNEIGQRKTLADILAQIV